MDTEQLDALADRIATNRQTAEDTELLRQIFRSYTQFFEIVADKNTSLRRLRRLMFGPSSEKTDDVLGKSRAAENQEASAESGSAPQAADAAEDRPEAKPKRPGHGRMAADRYPGARQVDVRHDDLNEGDRCPECTGGTLYVKAPRVIVRIVGQPPLGATVYHLQRLRCHLCGKVFTAREPEGVSGKKYDETAASMIGLLRYGAGLPFNRLERLQRSFGVPLPASTQWDVVAAIAPQIAPAYEALIRVAAQGEVVHNDDTTIKIQQLIKENAARDAADDERTGTFTTGIVATRNAHRVALFFSGRQHAGENLRDVLVHRADELDAPIQMCDGLSRNLPGELKTILANCLAHARRKFVDLADRFEEECEYVLEALGKVYHNDEVARRKKMSPERRLQYHRIKSEQTVRGLHRWLQRQLDEKRTEPNSALGQAITYLLKRWDAMTLFLRKPGAPLDNNIAENALKRAIVHRKNSLFYRTTRGARVGDMFMSLIYTCELAGVNPFEYLTALQRHADDVADEPARWLPWNYATQMAAETSAA